MRLPKHLVAVLKMYGCLICAWSAGWTLIHSKLITCHSHKRNWTTLASCENISNCGFCAGNNVNNATAVLKVELFRDKESIQLVDEVIIRTLCMWVQIGL